MFDRLLKEARACDVTPELALNILEDSRHPENALKLFGAASEMRDRHIGRELWWSAAINGITPCRIEPRCSYCLYSDHGTMREDSLLKALRALEKLGFRHLHLSGGASLEGYDEEIVSMVDAMRAVSDIDIEVNLGPSLSRETVRKLKGLNVCSITSSLETVNEELFRTTKPGDSLEKRKELLEICEAEGMPTRSMMLVGLGESDTDRIRQLFCLKGLKSFQTLRFSRFSPVPTTLLQSHPRCSPWEVARTIAVARLIMPSIQIGLANGNSNDDIPLWFAAGGGNQLLGGSVGRMKARIHSGARVTHITEDLTITDQMEIQERYARCMGLSITALPPGRSKQREVF
jgi:biotin synthase